MLWSEVDIVRVLTEVPLATMEAAHHHAVIRYLHMGHIPHVLHIV